MFNFGSITIIKGTFSVPGSEYGLGGLLQLLIRVSREFPAGIAANDLPESLRNGLPRICIETGIRFNLGFPPLRSKYRFKNFFGYAHHNTAKHLHQSPIQVIGKTRTLGQLCQAFCNFVIHTDVKNGIHHARH